MFWAEEIRHGNRYCVCKRKWRFIKIKHIKIFHDNLEIFVTPEGGERVLLLKLRNGESLSNYLVNIIEDLNWQHVKIEVYGGEITIGGSIMHTTDKIYFKKDKLPNECPFAEEEDWEFVSKKIVNIIPPNNSNPKSLESMARVIVDIEEFDKRSLIRKRFDEGLLYVASIENMYNEKNNKSEIGDLLTKFRSMLEDFKEDKMDYMEGYSEARDTYLPYFLYILKIISQIKSIHEREEAKKTK